MTTVQIVLKRPSGVFMHDIGFYSPGLYDPRWSVCKGYKLARPVRFTAFANGAPERKAFTPSLISSYAMAWEDAKESPEWMDVYCHDTECPELCGRRLVWKVREDYAGNRDHHLALALWEIKSWWNYKEVNSIKVIRLRLYWVLRGVVGFKRLLARVRLRHAKSGEEKPIV